MNTAGAKDDNQRQATESNDPNLMNIPNPLIPQGSLLEQKAKGKPHLRVAYFIVAAHLVFFGCLLMSQGCKRDTTMATSDEATNDLSLPPLDTSHLYGTNEMPQPGFPPANQVAATGAPPPELPFDRMYATQTTLPDLLAPEPPAPATSEYVVVPNDSFYTIGQKLGVPYLQIMKANPDVDPSRLMPGQKIIIPASTSVSNTAGQSSTAGGADNVYVVKSGDSLSAIAANHNTTAAELMRINGLSTSLIHPGDKLKLPRSAEADPLPDSSPMFPSAPDSGTSNPVSPGGTGNL